MLCQMAYNEASKKAVGIRVFRTKAWSWSTTMRFVMISLFFAVARLLSRFSLD